ncbi:hypothetical protein WA158_007544 [Blastocystis sp. Blastoise]
MELFRDKVFVFDLDYTIWPLWVDTHISPPVHPCSKGFADRNGQVFQCSGETIDILLMLYDSRIPICYASRTEEKELAIEVLKIYKIRDDLTLFDIAKDIEIFPGSKVHHIHQIQKKLNVNCDDIYFFDDEYRNISDVQKLGVHSYIVNNCLTYNDFINAMNIHI